MSRAVRIIGVGDSTPSHLISNEQIARTIPGWSADVIREKTGILERRFLCALDEEHGRAVRAGEAGTDMSEQALRGALQMAGIPPSDLDALFLVTCTPDEMDFNHDAMVLHQRLKLRAGAMAFVINDGCGGTPYVLDLVQKLVATGAMGTVAVVASNFASAYVDRRVYTGEMELEPGKRLSGYLSMYVFGDGAGAVVLRGDQGGGGVVGSCSGNAYEPLVLRRGGGTQEPFLLGDARPVDFAFVVNGYAVATGYPVHMRACLDGVTQGEPERLNDVKRFYLHQPNKRVLDRFAQLAGLAPERVACTVHHYGNTSAAGMLVALSEDVRKGTVALGSKDLVCIASAGANVHYGAQLIQL